MSSSINHAAAQAIAALPVSHRPPVVIGFDGFIDNIIAVVGKRTSATEFTPVETIAALASRIAAAAGKSTNLELVVKQTKIGGNGPIMASAMASLANAVTTIGLFGEGGVHPVFAPLATQAEKLINLGPSSVTDALEFDDGKVMLGKLQPLEAISWKHLLEATGGIDGLIGLLAPARGIATVNWTMCLELNDIWAHLDVEVLPRLPALPAGNGTSSRRLWFVDLADPAKRTAADLQTGLARLQSLQRQVDVVLGMNETECRQVLGVLGGTWPDAASEWEASALACAAIRDRLGLSWAMCHCVRSAAVAWADGLARPRGQVGCPGFFTAKPRITTGAGDHFNAGFFTALLAGLEPAHCIQAGGATSGHYVRTGKSPSRIEITAFLRAENA